MRGSSMTCSARSAACTSRQLDRRGGALAAEVQWFQCLHSGSLGHVHAQCLLPMFELP